MTDEYFDIVDENNQDTGIKKLRSVVHQDGSWHRVVHIYYYIKKNSKYYFLVHLRSSKKDLSPNMWDTRFGGHLKSGESIKQALVSELKEEIGLRVNSNSFISGLVYKRAKPGNNEFIYTYYYPGKEDVTHLKFFDKEVQAVKWLSAQDIIEEIKNNNNKWAPSLKSFFDIYHYLQVLDNPSYI